MKRRSVLLACLVLVALAATTAFGGENWRSGKKVFKKTCKTCHSRKGEGGKIIPTDRTQSQWRDFVEKDRHPAKPEVWEGLSEKELKSLEKYLLKYSADAQQAQTCG